MSARAMAVRLGHARWKEVHDTRNSDFGSGGVIKAFYRNGGSMAVLKAVERALGFYDGVVFDDDCAPELTPADAVAMIGDCRELETYLADDAA